MFRSLISSILLLVIVATALYAAEPPSSPATSALLFSVGRQELRGEPSDTYITPITGKPSAAELLFRGGRVSPRILYVAQERYALATLPDRFLLYRFPEGDVKEFKVKLEATDVQQLDKDRLVLLPRGYPAEHPDQCMLHILDLKSLKLKSLRCLPKDTKTMADWIWMGSMRAAPDLKHVAFFIQTKIDGKYPPVSDRTSSLVVADIGSGTTRVLASGLWKGWFAGSSISPPFLKWIDNETLFDFKLSAPVKEGTGTRVINILTGRISYVTDSERKQLVATAFDPPLLRLSDRYVFERLKEGPAVLRDTVTGKEIIRAWQVMDHPPVSPDGSLMAFTAIAARNSEWKDLYIYNSRTGETTKVFSGYYLGNLHWLGK